MDKIFNDLWEHRFELSFLIFLLTPWGKQFFKTFIFTPLAGGNGKVQMDELAKFVLLVMIAKASKREGISDIQVYPDIYWIMIFFSLWAIAGLKPAFEAFKNYKNGAAEDKT